MGRALISKWCAAAAALLVLLATTACETSQVAVKASPTTNTVVDPRVGGQGQGLRPGDKVKVEFSGVSVVEAGLKNFETEVKEDGTVSFELLGPVKVAGKPLGQIEREVLALYVPKFFLRLNVVITGPEKFYWVGGQVKTPGRQFYTGKVTILQAIQTAGDFTDFADQKKVQLIRGGVAPLTIDCKAAKKNPKLDVEIYPEDTIHVPQGL